MHLQGRPKLAVYYITLLFLPILVLLCVYGSFLGAEGAQSFFNSLPLIVYWILAAVLVVFSLFLFKKLRKPHLFLMHIGVILVILGSLLASTKGHELKAAITKTVKPVAGQMLIYEGKASDMLYQPAENANYKLPFEIFVKDFEVHYYPAYINIILPGGRTERLAARVGDDYVLKNSGARLKVLNVYENFKITFKDGLRLPVESEEKGTNPAVELEITLPGKEPFKHFVFERFDSHTQPGGMRIRYHRPIKDYVSQVDVIKDGRVVSSADIEVNRPLHYGGFHFYQHSYDSQTHSYTVLGVVSDNGLYLVYSGFAALCAGVVWYFWFYRLRLN
jgi:hypothetical protein